MNVLEKILEEIEDHAIEFESFGMCDDYVSVGWVKEIIRSHMGEVSDMRGKRLIDEQPTVYEANDWIPVEEKLPEESGYYMACIYNEEVDDYDFRKTWFAYVDDYDMDESEWRELYDFERVTAWQPLPEPYIKNPK